MSTTTETANNPQADVYNGEWTAGVIGGIAGAIVMAAAIIAMNTPTLAVAIPSLYTLAPPANVGLGYLSISPMALFLALSSQHSSVSENSRGLAHELVSV
jgi:hypothetical protein